VRLLRKRLWSFSIIKDGPTFLALHSVEGAFLHTAAYDRSVCTEGKRIALIGVGSSGIQILPALQPFVSRIYHFSRSKTRIIPSFAAKYAGPNESNFEYTDEQKAAFAARS
jgi:cation diffusion facilitator CzcD-associated flavoprotein CzcO